jgi:hypothetical protein
MLKQASKHLQNQDSSWERIAMNASPFEKSNIVFQTALLAQSGEYLPEGGLVACSVDIHLAEEDSVVTTFWFQPAGGKWEELESFTTPIKDIAEFTLDIDKFLVKNIGDCVRNTIMKVGNTDSSKALQLMWSLGELRAQAQRREFTSWDVSQLAPILAARG